MTPGYPVGIIPSSFLDPGAAALATFWPAANADPATTPGGYNYYEPIDNIHNGYTYRARVDYNYSDKTKFYFSFQYGNDSSLVQGNGAHIYWTPGDSIPFPGGGLSTLSTTKSVAGHFVHIFNSTTTNELIATWGYGNFPVGPSDISQIYKSTLGYPYRFDLRRFEDHSGVRRSWRRLRKRRLSRLFAAGYLRTYRQVHRP